MKIAACLLMILVMCAVLSSCLNPGAGLSESDRKAGSESRKNRSTASILTNPAAAEETTDQSGTGHAPEGDSDPAGKSKAQTSRAVPSSSAMGQTTGAVPAATGKTDPVLTGASSSSPAQTSASRTNTTVATTRTDKWDDADLENDSGWSPIR